MKRILIIGLFSASLGIGQFESQSVAGDWCGDRSVSYHGRIVIKYHKTWLGAAPAPSSPVVVQNAPSLLGVPFIAAAPNTGLIAYPSVPISVPVAPTGVLAVASPAATQGELQALREHVATIRDEIRNLNAEVRKVRDAAPKASCAGNQPPNNEGAPAPVPPAGG